MDDCRPLRSLSHDLRESRVGGFRDRREQPRLTRHARFQGLDLWPARKTRGRKFEERLIIEDKNNTLHFHKDRTLPGAPGGILLGSNADLEAGLASTRPSESSAGQYGSQANLVAESNGVTRPEMAHAAAAPTTNAAYSHSAVGTADAGLAPNSQPEMTQAAGRSDGIVYHNPHATPLSQSMAGHDGLQREAS